MAVNDLQAAALAAKRAQDLAAEATAHRDILIRDALLDGLSLRQVAALAGLSHTAVANIAARQPAS